MVYYSWFCGKIGLFIDFLWFVFYKFCGVYDLNLKIFMRGIVMVFEYLIYIFVVVIFVCCFSRLSGVMSWLVLIFFVVIFM